MKYSEVNFEETLGQFGLTNFNVVELVDNDTYITIILQHEFADKCFILDVDCKDIYLN